MKGRIRALTCAVTMLVLMAATARRSEMVGLPLDVSGLRPTPLATAELQDALRARDFAQLTGQFEAAQAAADRDISQEAAVGQFLSAFDTADPSLAAAADAWVINAPTSPAARLVRTVHGLARLRDREAGVGVTESAMTQFADDLDAALRVHPRLTLAAALRIRSSTLAGHPDWCHTIAGRALAGTSASLAIREALIECVAATVDQFEGEATVTAIVRDAAPHEKANPALRGLAGFPAWMRARQLPPASAIPAYTEALSSGAHWLFYRDRARAWLATGHAAEALADAGLGLALAPEQRALLLTRAEALGALGRRAEFDETLRSIRRMDPTNQALAAVTAREWSLALAAARRAWRGGNARAAIRAIDATAARLPASAEAFYWRGQAHLALGNPEGAFEDFSRAIALDGSHRAACVAADALLADRGDWRGLVQHWTAYLAFVPSDAHAYARRAYAYRRLDQAAAALLDEARLGDPAALAAATE